MQSQRIHYSYEFQHFKNNELNKKKMKYQR